MEEQHLIPARDFCTHYNVEYHFITSLQHHGLIEVTHIEDDDFIDHEQLLKLERFARMHYEMDINIEGIEAISNLLQQINEMQDELNAFRNKLSFYQQ